jgi:hypothetical protein
MDDLSRRAVAAALAVSRNLGLRCSDAPEVIADGSNVLVYLVPSPVVARVATTTALVRKPAEQWLALDLDLSGYLAARSFPVVPPSRELPPGQHQHDGLALTFWEFVEHDRNYVAGADEVGPFLREWHAELRGYPGALRPLSPCAEIPQLLDEVASWNNDESWNTTDPADIAMLRRGFAVISGEIEALDLPEQPLHGDVHKKNLSRPAKASSGRILKTPATDRSSGTSLVSSAHRSNHERPRSRATARSSISTASIPSLPLVIFREPRGAPSHHQIRRPQATRRGMDGGRPLSIRPWVVEQPFQLVLTVDRAR